MHDDGLEGIEKALAQVAGKYMSASAAQTANALASVAQAADAAPVAEVKAGAQRKIDLADVKRANQVEEFEKFYSFSADERTQLREMQDIIRRYVEQRTPSRPLCLAVFGSPGSGKSFAVKQLKSAVEKEVGNAKLKLPMSTLNLTQVSEPTELARALARLAGEQDEDTVPVVFFDEFDASRSGAPLGWLAWFLAPMNDGEILLEGTIFKLKRAIYVFAGGTAETMKEFSTHAQEPMFRAAKGPDFVSRLHGYLDVEGPNHEPYKFLRRAIILRDALDAKAKSLKEGFFEPDEEFLRSLLQAGRFRHGARSIKAVIELSKVSGNKIALSGLPPQYLMAPHVDFGPLDASAIGGGIALSGFGPNDDAKEQLGELFPRMARALWDAGATVVYGGPWDEYGGQSLAQEIAAGLRSLPRAPRRGKDTRPRLKLRKSARSERALEGVEFLEDAVAAGMDDADLVEHFPDRHEREWIAGEVLNRFVRRLQLAEVSAARFAISGEMKSYPGRFPGIAEEVMISLVLGKPVYIVGTLDGAARQVGALLGLARPWKGDAAAAFPVDAARQDLLDKLDSIEVLRSRLRPPPWDFPVTMKQLVAFFKAHALDGDKWPDNGLTPEENRELFRCDSAERMVQLVRDGLEKRFSGE